MTLGATQPRKISREIRASQKWRNILSSNSNGTKWVTKR